MKELKIFRFWFNLWNKKVSNFQVSGQKFVMFDNHIKVIGDGAFFSQLMQMKDGYTDGHNGKKIGYFKCSVFE